jgi:hypothetical protein
MAAALTVTRNDAHSRFGIRRYDLAWTSHTDGSVGLSAGSFFGEVVRVSFNPGATAPSAAYDVTITDGDGLDILAGQGANLHETNSSHVCPGVPLKDGTTTSVVPVAVHGELTLNITNAGDSKTGVIRIYLR